MTLPNLVIAGAPKCGTSSLFRWLVDHPDVCGSTVKEPFFLMDRDNPLRRTDCNVHDQGLEAYDKFFPSCGPADAIVVEASTHYIYQETAPEVLASLPTKPRVVFLLRKPSERVFSSFAYSKAKGRVRGDLSFTEFIGLIRGEPGDAAPEWAWGASAYVLPRDLRYSRYIDYLSQWHERLGPDRIRILLFEDLRADPQAVLDGLCAWLGIDPSYYDDYDFATRNRTVAVRSHGIQRLAQALAQVVPAGAVKDAVKRAYHAVQSRSRGAERTPADEAALAKLDEDFRPSVEELARQFGLDLGAWR